MNQSSDNIFNNFGYAQNVISSPQQGEWVKLNVGGQIIQTTLTTLRKDKDSMLYLMFHPQHGWNHCRDEQGAILVDADPRYFLVILNFLRHGELIVEPHLNYYGVWSIARYFQIKPIMDLLDIEDNDQSSWLTLLEDNFMAPDMDTTKWAVNRDSLGSAYDLEDEDGEVRLTGTWCRVNVDDFFQISTRCDGSNQGSPYFEIQNGLEFQYCRGTASIIGRGGLLPSGVVKIKKKGDFTFPAGVPVHFEIFDDGSNVSFTLWESISKTSLTIETTCTNRSLLNYIVFHNREKTGANHISYLSNVRVQRWTRATARKSKTKKLLKKMNHNLSSP
ncbi:hypothetical protein DFA_11225 [Cavenderia fasciculata]|uniref:BTB domain-containing protein n=1 Tax=Cavenderia fasciculata TaxID=261658 RepID=F4QFL1_CACFS|nr:uncharacterized protein DFA_11225 [Cavenderia fasciculata]EGG13464.1 hypothetical protein DFA_11225 [Cavenderia fasciculata]|eukprot:XP_004350168.1 hypothetical protein DFA_11225 [Cavenderia fasciculata]